MGFMTYKEQLLHPSWQRKRLEMLEAANWECSECGGKEKTLHVHHKQYIKGRMAWEYEATQLAVLCEDCHSEEHKSSTGIKELLSEIGTNDAYALVSGFNYWNDRCNAKERDDASKVNANAFAAGFVAWLVYHLDNSEMDKVAEFATSVMNDMAEPRLVYQHNSHSVFGRVTTGKEK